MNANVRIQWLHKKLLDGCFPNAQRLAERFHISHRQAQRDFDFLKKELSAPIAYNQMEKGFYYTERYSLPVLMASYNDDLYGEDIATLSDNNDLSVRESILQLQIPYSATIQLTDKLSVLELRPFIIESLEKNRYLCEFHSVERFLLTLLTMENDFQIIEPDWLRERILSCAERILKNHQD